MRVQERSQISGNCFLESETTRVKQHRSLKHLKGAPSKTSSVRALLSLPPTAQRYALLFCLVGTGTLAAGFAYERRVAGEPLRIERDDEGVLRWTRRGVR